MALNAMLAHSRGGTLHILPAVPNRWPDLQFKNLRVAMGLLVSLELRAGKLAQLVLQNPTPRPVACALEIPCRILTRAQTRDITRTVTVPARHRWSLNP